MPFIIVSEDITKMKVDAIVNAANNTLLGGGGVDGAIHRAAGPELLEYCRGLGGCETGAAKSTPGFRLPAKYVIHTVGPVWRGGNNGEEALLASCYKNSLEEAASLGCETVAFPLISSGIYGYPKREAVKVAENAILSFLEKHDITVYLSIFGDRRIVADPALLSQIRGETFGGYAQNSFCGAAMASAAPAAKPAPKPAAKEDKLASVLSKRRRAKASASREELLSEEPVLFDYCGEALEKEAPMADSCAPQYRPDKELENMLESMDESFSRNLLRRIDASGMTDAECYKRANIDRKLFSKIRSDEGYRPSKPTVIAFAIALRLDLPATLDLLRRAGMTLSRSSVFDVIIEYFITRKRYDVYEINEALFAFDQPLLGS